MVEIYCGCIVFGVNNCFYADVLASLFGIIVIVAGLDRAKSLFFVFHCIGQMRCLPTATEGNTISKTSGHA